MVNLTNDFDPSVLHIEVGAGCGNFGKLFFPKCYLTDFDENLKKDCENCEIDFFCKAEDLPFTENRFDLLILCNPYEYGFGSQEKADILFAEFTRVLKDQAKIMILSAHINKWGDPERIKKYLKKSDFKEMIFVSEEGSIDAKSLYKDYKFFTTEFGETKPNRQIILDVRKKSSY